MLPKPKHLGREYAEQFQDKSIVDAYKYRPLYPPGVFEILQTLFPVGTKSVLDVGCGTGNIARFLAPLVDRLDAVDFSSAMIQAGKQLPGGRHPNLNWIYGPVEEVPLSPPYGLITAGLSLHWLDWEKVFHRFRQSLIPGGYLAIVRIIYPAQEWDEDMNQILSHYSTNKDYQPYDIVEELAIRGLFEKQGKKRTAPMLFTQTIDVFIESWHSRNGLSRDRMDETDAAAFDREMTELVSTHTPGETFTIDITGQVIWGFPKTG